MSKRHDRRRKLLGRAQEAGAEFVTRDFNRTLKCSRCGGALELQTIPMTGQAVEVCSGCGRRHAVVRFRPLEDHEQP